MAHQREITPELINRHHAVIFVAITAVSDAPEDERESNLAGAFISLLDTVIVELNKAIEIHDKKINAE